MIGDCKPAPTIDRVSVVLCGDHVPNYPPNLLSLYQSSPSSSLFFCFNAIRTAFTSTQHLFSVLCLRTFPRRGGAAGHSEKCASSGCCSPALAQRVPWRMHRNAVHPEPLPTRTTLPLELDPKSAGINWWESAFRSAGIRFLSF